jgi:hypothetical protein
MRCAEVKELSENSVDWDSETTRMRGFVEWSKTAQRRLYRYGDTPKCKQRPFSPLFTRLASRAERQRSIMQWPIMLFLEMHFGWGYSFHADDALFRQSTPFVLGKRSQIRSI